METFLIVAINVVVVLAFLGWLVGDAIRYTKTKRATKGRRWLP